MRQVIIIANCHSMSLARAMALGARGVTVDFIDLNFLSRENEQTMIRRIYDGLPADAAVFAFNTSARFSPVSNAEIAPVLGDRLQTFTNIRFDGLHPDMTMLGPMDGRRHSAMGTYHSKIILGAYLQGLSPADCGRLFDYKIYEQLGYFDVFTQSAQTLLERDRHCDVKFAPALLNMVKAGPSLYSFNHPTGAVFQRLSAQLCAAAGIGFIDFGERFSINELANSMIWPIYDEIAEYHGLAYRTPQYYVGMQSFKSRAMSRAEMIRACYDVYGRQSKDDLRRFAQQSDFYAKLLEVLGQ